MILLKCFNKKKGTCNFHFRYNERVTAYFTIYPTRFNQTIITFKVLLLFLSIRVNMVYIYLNRNIDTLKSTCSANQPSLKQHSISSQTNQWTQNDSFQISHIQSVLSPNYTKEKKKMDLINQCLGNTTFHKIFYRILTL